MRLRLTTCIILAALAVTAALGTSAEPAMPVPSAATPVASPVPVVPPVYPPDESVFGASYGVWSARYWQWLVSLPIDANPALDASGTSCEYGQAGPVRFVPPNLPPCTVPTGVAVMVHIAGDICTTLDPDRPTESAAEIHSCTAAEADRYANISLQLDGQPVSDVPAFRFASSTFPVTLPERNILGVPGGVGLAASDGYWVVLAPLTPGEHEITVHLELTDGLVLPQETIWLTVVDPVQDATPVG